MDETVGLRDVEHAFVRLLYERSEGDTWEPVPGGQIGEELGLSRMQTGGLIRGLAAVGWLRPATHPQVWPLSVRITPLGIHTATRA